MKVKIMSSAFGLIHLENKINGFIKGKKLKDIKIQTSDKLTIALIIYEDEL